MGDDIDKRMWLTLLVIVDAGLVRLHEFQHARGGLGKPVSNQPSNLQLRKMPLLEDVEMDKLRVIFSRTILGRGETSSLPTAGFIEFLQIMSRLDWISIGGEVIRKGW